MCLKNFNNNCLKLDFRTIIDAYNPLGYGETLSEQQHWTYVFRQSQHIWGNTFWTNIMFFEYLQHVNFIVQHVNLVVKHVTILMLKPI